MSRDTHRVMPHPDGWQVKRDGDQRASHVTATKAEAEALARPISQHQHTELTVHGLDGRMQRSDSHARQRLGGPTFGVAEALPACGLSIGVIST